jgi:limonene-1,2-epoxide hydrolase
MLLQAVDRHLRFQLEGGRERAPRCRRHERTKPVLNQQFAVTRRPRVSQLKRSSKGEPPTSTNEQVIRDFIASWSRLNVDEIVAYFAPEGVYHNMMNKPVVGHDNLRRFIGGFIKDWTKTDWDVFNLLGRGNIVVAERLDRTRVGEKNVDLPCCGVFEMQDGKIRVWRDYFDLATYTRAIIPGK